MRWQSSQRPDEWRTSAYTVVYFFEHLGLLVAYDLVPEEFVVDFSANLIGRSWHVLEPFVRAERDHRKRTSPPGVSPNFVSHFEDLVALAIDESGAAVDGRIHRKLGLRSMPRRVSNLPEVSSTEVDSSMP